MAQSLQKHFSETLSIICGGSKGIGRAVAIELARAGGNVCIIARDRKNLEDAVKEIKANSINSTQLVDYIAADTTNMKVLKPQLDAFIKKNGIPDYLMNFVGYAYPQYIENLKVEDFKKNMDINYYGQLVPILVILPYFMKQKSGYITTTSSVSGYLGLMGYSTYTPTKFAICGITESLRHELSPSNINFSILYPPDTETPGFDNENKTKPAELAVLSEGGGLLGPEIVAVKFLKGIIKKNFYILPGQARLLWFLMRHFPTLSHWLLDRELKKARKKLGR